MPKRHQGVTVCLTNLTRSVSMIMFGPPMREQGTYRDVLVRDFEQRCHKNPRYSLRAYARDLGLSPASVSLILNRKQGLSVSLARRLAERLGLSAEERAFFCDSVESEHSRSDRRRELARVRLRRYDRPDSTLQLDVFKALSDWYHLAIIELTETKSFKNDILWIAKTLDIPEKATALAVERLKNLGFLEEVDGRLRQTTEFRATPTGIPSDYIKKFHQQILHKAEKALFTQHIERRDFSTLIFPMNEKDIPWARQRIKEFRRELMARLERAPSKNTIYSLSIQLFSLLGESR